VVIKRTEKFTYAKTVRELKSAGTTKTAELYGRIGAGDRAYGVSYAALKTLDKRIASNQELADQLWASQWYEARILACWVADPERVTLKLLDSWCRDITSSGMVGELANLAAYVDVAAKCSRKWRKVKAELKCAMGWSILGIIAMQPDRDLREGGVTDQELRECLEQIEARIHGAPNRAKLSMNHALIGIGGRSSMTREALAVAKRVGSIDVDYGKRGCKTRTAYDAIKKTVAHYKAQGKKPTDGSAGQRRRHC
jgi:hypothetical protein